MLFAFDTIIITCNNVHEIVRGPNVPPLPSPIAYNESQSVDSTIDYIL